METLDIFALQFFLSLVVYALLARWCLHPWLDSLTPTEALFWLTVPHAFRHVGLVFLVPGVVAPSMPGEFAAAAGYGDLAAGGLAILALIALRHRWTFSLGFVWLFSIVGTWDLVNALTHTEVVSHFQSAWYIPTFVVPFLLLTHLMIFLRLLKLLNRPQGLSSPVR